MSATDTADSESAQCRVRFKKTRFAFVEFNLSQTASDVARPLENGSGEKSASLAPRDKGHI